MIVSEFFENFKTNRNTCSKQIQMPVQTKFVTFLGETALLCPSSPRWREGGRRAVLREKDQERRKSKNSEYKIMSSIQIQIQAQN